MSERRHEWLPVAHWEVLRVLKRKDFVVSVLLMPVLMLVVVGVTAWFRSRDARATVRVAVVTADGGEAAAALPPLAGFQWLTPPPQERGLEALEQAVSARRFEGALLLPADYATRGGVQLVVRRSNPGWKGKLEQHLHAQARAARAASLGLAAADLERLDAAVHATEVVSMPQGRVSRADRVAAGVFMSLLIMALFVSASYLAIGITGEKQARVTEVVVSAIRPQAWTDGKIAAYTVVGLAQVALWCLAAAAMLLFFRVPLSFRLSPAVLAVSALMFLLGLALYMALFGLVLATIKDLQSTSKFQAYLYFLPLIPFFFLAPMIRAPDAPWVMVVSQVPFFAPFLIPGRLTLGAVAWWEVALAVALVAGTAQLLRLAAGHAFRVGMLMYGKELSLPELIRWSRQA